MTDAYRRDTLDGQLKTELLTALQPAFARISDLGIRYSALPGHTLELADALNDVLTEKWRKLRGIEIVSVGVSSVKASEEDEQMIKRAAARRRLPQSDHGCRNAGRRPGRRDAGRCIQ